MQDGVPVSSVFPTAQTEDTKELANQMYSYMMDDLKLPSENHALGLLANIQRESNFNPSVPSGDDGGAGGLWQYKGARQTQRVQELVAAGDWKGQIKYALQEEPGNLAGRPGLVQEFLNTKFSSPQEAADWWAKNWERPHESIDYSKHHNDYLQQREMG